MPQPGESLGGQRHMAADLTVASRIMAQSVDRRTSHSRRQQNGCLQAAAVKPAFQRNCLEKGPVEETMR